MKKSFALAAALVLMAIAVPALAGDEEYAKCEKSAEACLQEHAAMLKKRGWVGIEMEQTEDGMLAITRVIADSPAEKAGFQAGDVLTSVNGLAYAQADEAKRKAVWQEMLPGKKMSYVVDRGGKSLDVEVVLASIPETVMAQWIGQHMLMAHLDHSEELPASP